MQSVVFVRIACTLWFRNLNKVIKTNTYEILTPSSGPPFQHTSSTYMCFPCDRDVAKLVTLYSYDTHAIDERLPFRHTPTVARKLAHFIHMVMDCRIAKKLLSNDQLILLCNNNNQLKYLEHAPQKFKQLYSDFGNFSSRDQIPGHLLISPETKARQAAEAAAELSAS